MHTQIIFGFPTLASVTVEHRTDNFLHSMDIAYILAAKKKHISTEIFILHVWVHHYRVFLNLGAIRYGRKATRERIFVLHFLDQMKVWTRGQLMNDRCTICLDTFLDVDQNIVVSDCLRHSFHRQCMSILLSNTFIICCCVLQDSWHSNFHRLPTE